MEITPITSEDGLWSSTIEYAEKCPWRAGPFLADAMKKDQFTDWERVFVAREQKTIIGFCTCTKTDCIPDVSYSPYISAIFVDEQYRGKRISEKMIQCVMAYAKEHGFEEVYVVSSHINLYEKYGFVQIDEKRDVWGNAQKIYVRAT